MSRVGKMPIVIPPGVRVEVEGSLVRVTGPKGVLQRKVHPDMRVLVEDGKVVVLRPSDSKQHKALHGLTRSLIANMTEGVTKGFEKTLLLEGVGYRASMSKGKLVLNVGFSHPVEIEPPEDIHVEVPNPTTVVVRGCDKEKVGQLAARIRAVKPPEPYKGAGIRYAGEKVRRKVGKSGK